MMRGLWRVFALSCIVLAIAVPSRGVTAERAAFPATTGEMAPESQITVAPLPASAHRVAAPARAPEMQAPKLSDANPEPPATPITGDVSSARVPVRTPRPLTSTTGFEGLDLVTSADNGWTSGVPDTQLTGEPQPRRLVCLHVRHEDRAGWTDGRVV